MHHSPPELQRKLGRLMNTNQSSNATVAGTLVLDSNAFGAGRLTRASIRRIREARNLGLRVCVPDVVAAELAAHEDQELGKIIESLKALGYLLSEDTPINEEQFEKSTIETLGKAGAIILHSTSDALHDALWAQIFRRKPASPKRASSGKAITTGAVDALVQIHALREAQESWTCLVTEDSALRDDSLKRGLRVEGSIPAAIEAARSSALNPERGREILSEILCRESEILKVLGGKAVIIGVSTIQSTDSDSCFEATIAWFDDDLARHGLDEYSLTRVRGATTGIEIVGARGDGLFTYWNSHLVGDIREFVYGELSLVPEPFRPTLGRRRRDACTPFWVRLEGETMELLRGDERLLWARVEKISSPRIDSYDGEVHEWTDEFTDFRISVERGSEEGAGVLKGILFAEICHSMGLLS